MENFIYCAPTKVVFGKDTVENLGSEMLAFNAKKVLIVYGSNRIEQNGLLDTVKECLKKCNIEYLCFSGVKANPTVEHAKKGVLIAKEFKADFILAIGGGSCIDTAKAIAVGAVNDVDLWKVWCGEESFSKALNIACILTIPAAGSEMSNSAVLTNETIKQKRGLGSEMFRPRFAIMDPCFAMTLPKRQIACGVVDILMHTLDRYFYRKQKQHNNLTDAIATAILKTVLKFGLRVYENPLDYEAMSEIMWASSLSHNDITGLGGDRDFSVHQLGHELSAKYDIPHGESLSMMWGSWCRYVLDKDLDRFIKFANMVLDIKDNTKQAALGAIAEIERFFAKLDMPISLAGLADFPLDDATLKELAKNCSRENTRKVGSFALLDSQDIYEIYKLANK